MADSIITRAKTAALVALAEHGITTDVQELLLRGDERGTVAPGALDKMLRAAIIAMRDPTPDMRQALLRELSGPTDFDPKVAAWDAQRGYQAMIKAAAMEPVA